MSHTKWIKALLLSLILTCAAVLFQNCAKLGSSHESKLSSLSYDLLERKIWSLNQLFVSSEPMVFYINPNIFDADAEFGWFYKLNGSSAGCSISPYYDYPNAIEMECVSPGVLSVTLFAVDSDLGVEKIYLNVEVESISSYPSLDEEMLYLDPEQLVLNLDGTPGPAYKEIPIIVDPGASGAALYAAFRCAECHGDLANSEVKGKTSVDIRAAITGGKGERAKRAMGGLNYLTDAELKKIADALK